MRIAMREHSGLIRIVEEIAAQTSAFPKESRCPTASNAGSESAAQGTIVIAGDVEAPGVGVAAVRHRCPAFLSLKAEALGLAIGVVAAGADSADGAIRTRTALGDCHGRNQRKCSNEAENQPVHGCPLVALEQVLPWQLVPVQAVPRPGASCCRLPPPPIALCIRCAID